MGQICTATSRIYVQDTIYDTFIKQFKQYTIDNSKVGNPFDSSTNHGPQVSKAQRDRILSYIQTTKDEGAELVLGGGGEDTAAEKKGYFVKPTIFSNVSQTLTAVREEVFGPFVVIQSFSTEKDAIAKANDTQYGLGAAVFTENITRGHRVAAAIQAGMVWVCYYLLLFYHFALILGSKSRSY
jgi:aldehyde dehydrogenase (NAD(P)+)